ncbi:CaaX prenyl proteinase Rce1 [Blumeria hordei DH14]|uniref:intramembrane prenyl-peptidase Rce1 n=1 Tax=Blumeria graminis f. sp. hordei (strain DH14) TaxID=546991 RepID=N1J9V3_BLUG1|nr:CaaX prenyl proteinase Rce1 [Blumeria hordei DH14]
MIDAVTALFLLVGSPSCYLKELTHIKIDPLYVHLRRSFLCLFKHAAVAVPSPRCPLDDPGSHSPCDCFMHYLLHLNLMPLTKMGYIPVGIAETLKSLALTSILYAGPIFEKGFVLDEWKDWVRLRGFQTVLGSWIGWRNYVVGPVTEEVLFRSASVPLLLLCNMSVSKMILLGPIIFGLAHFHHFYEFRVTHPDTPVIVALLRSALQLSYTSLFGAYATFIYLRTGSLLSVIAVHAFCNWMGLPRIWGTVRDDQTGIHEGVGEIKRGHAFGRRKISTFLYTMAYYVLLVAGAYGWGKYLWKLTSSPNKLIEF